MAPATLNKDQTVAQSPFFLFSWHHLLS